MHTCIYVHANLCLCMHCRDVCLCIYRYIHAYAYIEREEGGGREGGRKVCFKEFAYATVEMQVQNLQAGDPRKSCHLNSDAKAISLWNSFLLGGD